MQLSPLVLDVFGIRDAQIAVNFTIASFIIALIITLILMKPAMQSPWRNRDSQAGSIIAWSILGVFLAYFAQTISVAIETYLFGVPAGSENTQGIMNIARAFPLFIIIPALIAPILEEIIFRKIIFGTLYKRINFFFAAVISAVIFGIIHGEPAHLLIYASMGFVFSFLYVKTKSILTPIIVHMSMNSISVLVQFNLDPEDIERMMRDLENMKTIFIGG